MKNQGIFLVILLAIALLVGCGLPDQDLDVVEIDKPKSPATGDISSAYEKLSLGLNITTYTYDLELTMNGHLQATMQYFQNGLKKRMEIDADGQKKTLIIRDKDNYVLLTETKQFIRLPSAQLDQTMDIGSFALTVEEDQVVGVERQSFDGLNTYMLNIESAGSSPVSLYLHPEYGFPIRMKTTDPLTNDILLMEVINFQVVEVADGVFEIPEDWESLNALDMMGNMLGDMLINKRDK